MKEIALWIALVSLLISFASAVFSLWSTMIAKRSLRLSEEQAKARLPNLVPYLLDGLVRTVNESKKRIYAFSLSLSNRSDSDNSLSALELRIIYNHENGVSSNILMPHDFKLAQDFGLEGSDPFIIPTNINAHGTIAGWAFFKIDNSILRDVIIDKYEIRFLDAHGKESSVEPIILREIIDEEKRMENS
jgi:hypothetical protein